MIFQEERYKHPALPNHTSRSETAWLEATPIRQGRRIQKAPRGQTTKSQTFPSEKFCATTAARPYSRLLASKQLSRRRAPARKPDRSDLFVELVKDVFQTQEAKPVASSDIWRHANANRARYLARLVLLLEERTSTADHRLLSRRAELALARNIIQPLELLGASKESDVWSCREIIESIVFDLSKLFGPALGQVTISTEMDDLWMSARRCRALIFFVIERLLYTFLYRFCGLGSGKVWLKLTSFNDCQVLFSLTHNGGDIAGPEFDESFGLLCRIAGVLGAEMLCGSPDPEFSLIQMQFAC